jgi:hypothetical protein
MVGDEFASKILHTPSAQPTHYDGALQNVQAHDAKQAQGTMLLLLSESKDGDCAVQDKEPA